MRIVLAGPERADVFARLHALCFPAPWSASAFHGSLLSMGAIGLLAENDAQTLGLALISAAGDEAEILTIAVAPNAQRGGVGRALMHSIEAQARARGARAILLDVAADNIAARALYDGLGYKAVGQRKAYYSAGRDAPVDSLTLRLTLE
jgi:ribosomal-protein-alanine N-acetyltransferase